MAETTEIAWCDSTFNPWMGCTRVSPACDNCYAAVSTPARTMGVPWGAGQPRRRTSPANWSMPLRWEREHAAFFAEHSRRRRVFCASLADVFDNEVDPAWRADLLRLIADTPNLDWLLLTKRIGNAGRMIADTLRTMQADPLARTPHWPWPNVWLGATICNQVEADRDIPKLLAVPAEVRFLSIEPLLGAIDVRRWMGIAVGGSTHQLMGEDFYRCDLTGAPLEGIDWVIAGGESGHGARPMHPDWARSLRDQCAGADAPFLFKQWGNWVVDEIARSPARSAMPGVDPKRRWLEVDGSTYARSTLERTKAYAMVNVGKRQAGRLLDGRTHGAFPAVNATPTYPKESRL